MTEDPFALISPLITSATIELASSSRIFRKQCARVGQIQYQGERYDFTPEFLDGLTKAHKENVFDACHLMFAGHDNKHTKDVERVRGRVLGFELDRATGRYDAIIQAANDKTAQLLRENPQIGVSLSIESPAGSGRTDGRTWPAGVNHVLATIDARMTGLAPWEPIELSTSDDRQVFDLSAASYLDLADPDPEPQVTEQSAAEDTPTGGTTAADTTQEEAGTVPDTPTEGGGGFSDADIQKMRDMLKAWDDQSAVPQETDEPEFTEEELRQAAADFLAMTDQPGTETAATVEDETEVAPEPVQDREPVAVGLSYEAQRSIDLANSRADRFEIELSRITAERDEERFAALVRDWAELGIPPRITELAKPLLVGQHSIELSSGDQVDPGRIVRDVVLELAKSRQLDLSSADTVFDADQRAAETAETTARDAWAKDFLAANGH